MAEQALRRSEEAQRLLASLNDATRGLRDADDLMFELVKRVGMHFAVTRCTYGEIDAGQEHLIVSRDYTGGVASLAGRHRLEDFGPALVRDLKAGLTVVVPDVALDPRTKDEHCVRSFAAIDTRSLLCVPLVKQGHFAALFVLLHADPRRWSDDEAALMEQIAERTWFAVESARGEAALRESRDVLSLAMRSGRMGAWSRNLVTEEVWWSRELEEIFGLAPGGFEGTQPGFRAFVHDEDRPRLEAAVAAALTSGHDYIVEFRFRHASGEWRWMEGRGRAVEGNDGSPISLFGLGIDITERKVFERELAAARDAADADAGRLSLALAAARLGDWSWDAASDVVTCSPRAAEIFEIPPGPHMTWTRMRDELSDHGSCVTFPARAPPHQPLAPQGMRRACIGYGIGMRSPASALGGVRPSSSRLFWRRLVLAGLVVAVGASLLVLGLLAAGLGGRHRFGPLQVTVNDFVKPLLWGFVAVTWLLIQEWRRTRWRLAGIGLAAALGVLAIVNFARASPPITTDADFAVIELYTELATRGRLLLGPYSRFGWNHPGPMYFYLQAPFYALSGHTAASLYAGALAINLAAIITLAWVTGRENRGALLVLLTAACLLFAWRVPRFLASPWTAHVPILPSLAFAVLCAAVAGGRRRLLPLTVAFGTFIAQTHLALVPVVGLLLVALAIHVILQGRRGDAAPAPVLVASACVCMALWLLPVSEALSHAGGNISALWQFFVVNPGDGQSVRQAFVHWSYALTGVLRPDLELPWGGHVALQYLWWGIPCAIAQVLLLAAIARRDLKAGRAFEGWLALASLTASIVGVWALTRIRGDILNHEIFWLSGFGAMNLAVIGAAGLRRFERRGPVRWTMSTTAVGSCILLLALGLALGVSHLRDLTSFELRRTERAVILAAHESVRGYLREQGIERPLVSIGDSVWTEAAGVLLRLYQDGVDFGVAEAPLPVFTGAFPITGREDALIHITGPGPHGELRNRPANAVLLESRSLYVDAVRITPVLSR